MFSVPNSLKFSLTIIYKSKTSSRREVYNQSLGLWNPFRYFNSVELSP